MKIVVNLNFYKNILKKLIFQFLTKMENKKLLNIYNPNLLIRWL